MGQPQRSNSSNLSQSALPNNRSVATNDSVPSSSNRVAPIPNVEPRAIPINLATSSPNSLLEEDGLANNEPKIYKISVGAFSDSSNAKRLVAKIDRHGL